MIAIVDYRAGNLASVKRAFDHLGIACEVTADPARVAAAERVVFPGVGHAAAAMAALRERGLDQALRDAFRRGTPILGICLGAQIVLDSSEEGDTACLGLLPGRCVRFRRDDPLLKVPHMGWDRIEPAGKPHPLLRAMRPGDEFYFVHTYYPAPAAAADAIATCEYGIEFAAMIGRANLVAAQFHPEKSGEAGLAILEAFSGWDGSPC